MTDILDIKVMLSNFDGQEKINVRELIGYASMQLEEIAYHARRKTMLSGKQNRKNVTHKRAEYVTMNK